MIAHLPHRIFFTKLLICLTVICAPAQGQRDVRALLQKLMEDLRKSGYQCKLYPLAGRRGNYGGEWYPQAGTSLTVTVPSGLAAGQYEVAVEVNQVYGSAPDILKVN
jgi:hypothetical protein